MTKVRIVISVLFIPLVVVAELTTGGLDHIGNLIISNTSTDLPGKEFPSTGECKRSGNPDPWEGLSLEDRVSRIVTNVQSVNSMHSLKMDVRFMLCRADHESTLNPLERNCDSTASGLFGITKTTTKDILNNTDWKSQIQGFSDLSGDQFHKKMATSTLAQTEMAIGILLEKAKVVGKRSAILEGSTSTEDWGEIARAYFGLYKRGHKFYNASINYKREAKNCYDCMIEKYNQDGTVKDADKKCFKEEKA